jgi:hypothetical protein
MIVQYTDLSTIIKSSTNSIKNEQSIFLLGQSRNRSKLFTRAPGDWPTIDFELLMQPFESE